MASSLLDVFSSGPKTRKLIHVRLHHVAEEGPQRAGVLGLDLPGLVDLEAILPEIRHAQRLLEQTPVGVGLALMRRLPAGASSFSSGISLPSASNSSSGFCARIQLLQDAAVARGFFFTSASGTWCARQKPSSRWPSTSSGAVQPFGVRSTIIGHRGRRGTLVKRALLADIS